MFIKPMDGALDNPCKRARTDEHEMDQKCPICQDDFQIRGNMTIQYIDRSKCTLEQCRHAYHISCLLQFCNSHKTGIFSCCVCRMPIEKTLTKTPTRNEINRPHDEQEHDQHPYDEDEIEEDTNTDEDDYLDDPDFVPPETHRHLTSVVPLRRSLRTAANTTVEQPQATAHPTPAPTTDDEEIEPFVRPETPAIKVIRGKIEAFIDGKHPILTTTLNQPPVHHSPLSSDVNTVDNFVEWLRGSRDSIERMNDKFYIMTGNFFNNAQEQMTTEQYTRLSQETCKELRIHISILRKWRSYATVVIAYPILFLAACKYSQVTRNLGNVKTLLTDEHIQEYVAINQETLQTQFQTHFL